MASMKARAVILVLAIAAPCWSKDPPPPSRETPRYQPIPFSQDPDEIFKRLAAVDVNALERVSPEVRDKLLEAIKPALSGNPERQRAFWERVLRDIQTSPENKKWLKRLQSQVPAAAPKPDPDDTPFEEPFA